MVATFQNIGSSVIRLDGGQPCVMLIVSRYYNGPIAGVLNADRCHLLSEQTRPPERMQNSSSGTSSSEMSLVYQTPPLETASSAMPATATTRQPRPLTPFVNPWNHLLVSGSSNSLTAVAPSSASGPWSMADGDLDALAEQRIESMMAMVANSV